MDALRRTIKYEKETKLSKKKIVVECIKEFDKKKLKAEESKWERKRGFKKIGSQQGRHTEEERGKENKRNCETNDGRLEKKRKRDDQR